MARFFWRDGQFVDSHGQPMELPKREFLAAPNVISDIGEYRSPVDGRPITSRSARREDLKRNNCVEFEPSMSPTGGKLKNERFCAKRGLQVSEEYR